MKTTKMLLLGSALSTLLFSCKKESNQPPIPPTGSGDTVYLRGNITSDMTLNKEHTYFLRGYVYVDGATLHIEPGTRIYSKRDSAGVLVIYKGARINAVGTPSEPIVFTSGESNPQPGDLGGLILVGEATVNGNHAAIEGGVDNDHKSFGGSNDADNSGTLKYVRIEYPGKAVNPGDEVNGLSLYGVGSSTTLDYVQIVRGLDDAFEFFGGAVNAKHLIAYNCADDDFDMDDGYHGKIQYAISLRDPGFTDAKGTSGDLSNMIEVDNTNGKLPYNTTPRTSPLLANFTAVGPNDAAGTSSDHGYGMRWRRGSRFRIANSIIMGGQKGIMNLRDTTTIRLFQTGESFMVQCYLYTPAATPFVVDQAGNLNYTDAMLQAALLTNNTIMSTENDVMLSAPFNNTTPDFQLTSASPARSGAVWPGPFADAFFEQVAFVGAMDAHSDWTSGWAVWGK